MLSASFDRQRRGWIDRTLNQHDVQQPVEVVCDIRVATLNVGTMHYVEGRHEGSSHKARELQHQFHKQHVDVACIQESRARHTQMLDHDHYCRLIAAGN